MSPSGPTDGVRSEAHGSMVWDPREDVVIKIDAVTKYNSHQGAVVAAEDNDSTYFERTDLDDHANMVVLGRKCYIVDLLGRTAEVHPFSPDHEALKVSHKKILLSN